MRTWLRWLLAASALAAAVALWWPDGVSQAVLRSETAIAGSQAALNTVGDPVPSATGGAVSPTLPSHLPTATLDPANFDPFVGAQPPPPPPPKPQPLPVVVAPPPPAPTAPPLTYRYLGQMVDPSGQRLVYLGKGDKDVLVAVGTQLDEGYVVETISTDGIQLHYPPLDVRAVINIPPARDTTAP